MEKVKLFEAFAGVGTQHMALKNIGVAVDPVGISEIDDKAVQAYNAIHGDVPNWGDISKIDTADLPDIDLFTYSFPCQDISLSGNILGFSEGSGTRSSLLWECSRIIKDKKPKYLLLENVKNLASKRFKDDFDKWIQWLDDQGYSTSWQILNAKDYNIPQNRERVFAVSVLGDSEGYEFPEKMELTNHLKDLLEDDVSDDWYLSEEMQDRFRYNLNDDFVKSKLPKSGVYDVVGSTQSNKAKGTNSGAWVYSKDSGVMSCLSARDYKQPKMVVDGEDGFVFKSNTKKGYDVAYAGDGFNYSYPNSKTRRGRVGRKVTPTLQTGGSGIGAVMEDLRIRKLTPLEYWRLMGINDEDFYKAQASGISNTHLYHQAGNAIVVDVLEQIFRKLLIK